MFSPEEVTQHTDALEQLPRSIDRRSALIERRQNILQQKQTDSLPAVSIETPNAKLAWRQVTQLREENRRLRSELSTQRAEVQRLIQEYENLKGEFEREVAVVHSGHQQEVAQYQSHLQEAMDERNRLHEAHVGLEQRYQELEARFQQAVEEEAHKRVASIGDELVRSPEQVPVTLQETIKELKRQAQEESNKYLAEAVFLKRQAKRVIEALEQERQDLARQRQEVYAWQYNMSQQLEERQKVLHNRLQSRQKAASILGALGLVAALLALQLICLALLHIPMTMPIAFALIAPIVICVFCSFFLSRPITLLRHMFRSVPHLHKVKKG